MAEHHKNRLGYEDTVNFTNSLFLSYTLFCAAVRAYYRYGIYGIDDAVIAAATVSTLGYFVANYLAWGYGAGKPWSYIEADDHVASFNQASMASVVLFTISLYLSKCSVVAFLLRVTKDRHQILLYRSCLSCLGAVGLASILLLTTGWSSVSAHYWASSADASACTVQSSRWEVWTALDILTELLLLILPLHMTWNLQMSTKTKTAVVGAFYLRIPVIGLSIGRLIYTQRLCENNNDLGLATALALIWMCVEAGIALLVSHFLALRALTLSFNSGFGFGFTINAGPESYSMQHRSRTGVKSQSGGGTQDAGLSRSGPSEPVSGGKRLSSRDPSSLSIVRETRYSLQYQDAGDEAPILSRA